MKEHINSLLYGDREKAKEDLSKIAKEGSTKCHELELKITNLEDNWRRLKQKAIDFDYQEFLEIMKDLEQKK